MLTGLASQWNKTQSLDDNFSRQINKTDVNKSRFKMNWLELTDSLLIYVTLWFQVKITSHNEEMLRAAVEQFIDKDRKDIEGVAMETLEGHQRAMMGAMTVDEIFKDRIKFSTQVFDIASTDLFNMGIQVISYTLKDIKDEDQYMVSLGKDKIVLF